MIDKQQVLDSITGQVLNKMDQEIRAAIEQKVTAIVQQHLATLDITTRVDNNIGEHLRYLIEDNNQQLLLNRFVEKTDVAIGMTLAKIKSQIQTQIDQDIAEAIDAADISNSVIHSVDIAQQNPIANPRQKFRRVIQHRSSKAVEKITDQQTAETVGNYINSINIDQKINNSIGEYLRYLIEGNNQQLLLNRFVEKTDVAIGLTLASLPDQIHRQVAELVKEIVNGSDIANTVNNTVAQLLPQLKLGWPDRSIPASAINFDHAVISATALRDGRANNFASTGLSDFASNSVLTLTDEQTIVDTTLTVKGNLVVLGTLETDTEFYRRLSKDVADSVATNIAAVVDAARLELTTGVSVHQILLNNEPVVSGGTLSRFVTDSNLQKVGRLRELDVAGEALINETVYVGRRRMGINTLEPQSALDIWDQEVEIIAEKLEANTGYLGLGKTGTLRLGVDRRNAITILPNADVEIPGLKIGRVDKIALAVGSGIPTGPGEPGDIIFNNRPLDNNIFAWVCLEGTRWAPVRLDI
jgi:hypothetical protein